MKVIRVAGLLAIIHLQLAAGEKQYPLKVQILQTQWARDAWGAHGSGQGNIINGESKQGFDFAYNCGSAYDVSRGDTYYPARWKKEPLRLVIEGFEIGGKNKPECELKTTVRDTVYGLRNGVLIVLSRQQDQEMRQAWKQYSENLHPSDTDLAHYPLRIVLFAADWQQNYVGVAGSGKGNVFSNGTAEGFNFSANCPGRLNAGGTIYLGKWTQNNSRLLLLARSVGGTDIHTCELRTDLAHGVYGTNAGTGVVRLMTHEEYNAVLAKARLVSSPSTSNGTPTGTAPAAKVKLSIRSTPDGADIEIDGKYVGSTPSILEWTAGEHMISVKKPGYSTWIRKMTMTSGEVKVEANLADAAPNFTKIDFRQ